MAAPRHVLLELDDDDDDRSIDSASSAAFGIESSATSSPPGAPAICGRRRRNDDALRACRRRRPRRFRRRGRPIGRRRRSWSRRAPERRRSADLRVADEDGARTTSSRFWGVSWHRRRKKWQAYYKDADGKKRHVGCFDDEEEAARAVNKAISDAGLEDQRRMNVVDATGALVPRAHGVTLARPRPAASSTGRTRGDGDDVQAIGA